MNQSNPPVRPDLVRSLLDLSRSGARLLVAVPLEEGQEVALALQEPSQPQPLTIPAVVVWSAAGEGGGWVGVFFWRWLHHTQFRALTEA